MNAMVAEIDHFVSYQVATIYHNRAKVSIFKLIYFFTLSTKINKHLLPNSTFYAESNKHKISL